MSARGVVIFFGKLFVSNKECRGYLLYLETLKAGINPPLKCNLVIV